MDNKTAVFVAKARYKHGDKYDYSKVVYESAVCPVTIHCKAHEQEFQQRPGLHLAGSGCPECGKATKAAKHLASGERSFLTKSKAKHGDKYDYSRVVYAGSYEKVIIICPEHGEFLLAPISHQRGGMCQKCAAIQSKAKQRAVAKEQFLAKANRVHGGRYTYDMEGYAGSGKQLTITCPDHGKFSLLPMSHARGSGCPKCNIKITAKKGPAVTTESFIARLEDIYPGEYDASRVEYLGQNIPVTLICKQHGTEFTRNPRSLYMGYGCPICKVRRLAAEWLDGSMSKHEGYYTYDKVKYVNAYTNVTITCPEHGDFQQRPNSHLSGHGCPECGVISKTIPPDAYARRVKELHPELILDERSVYTGYHHHITVKCLKHDYVSALAGELLRVHRNGIPVKGGCPVCTSSKGARRTYEFLMRLGVDIVREYRHPALPSRRYDFYLPKLNILIEYDGRQHVEPVKHWGGLKGIALRKKKDREKTAFAKPWVSR